MTGSDTDFKALAQAALDAKAAAEMLFGALGTAARMRDEDQQIPAQVVGTIEDSLRDAQGALAKVGDVRQVPEFAHAFAGGGR